MAKRPLTAIPATRSPAKVLKAKQTTVMALLVGCMLAGPLSFVLTVLQSSDPVTSNTVSHPTTVASFAEIVARDYLSGRPTIMPVAEDVDPTFGFAITAETQDAPGFAFESLTLYSVRSSIVDQRSLYTSIFRVQTTDGLFDLTIVTGQDALNLSILVAQPSLTRSTVAASAVAEAPRYQLDPNLLADTPGSVIAAAERWAAPFADDDRDQLRLVVGGGPQQGDYVGIGGFALSGRPEILAVVAAEDGSATVRARLVFSQTGANRFQSSSEFDLLVQDYTSADARVVAWGPAGSGPTLTPYQNNTANQ